MSSPSSADAVPDRRGVALLGSTGSIGAQAVEVLAAHPELFRVVALATRSNALTLEEQADRLRPAAALLGPSEDDLVELTNAHLMEQHDGRTYDRDMILMLAT